MSHIFWERANNSSVRKDFTYQLYPGNVQVAVELMNNPSRCWWSWEWEALGKRIAPTPQRLLGCAFDVAAAAAVAYLLPVWIRASGGSCYQLWADAHPQVSVAAHPQLWAAAGPHWSTISWLRALTQLDPVAKEVKFFVFSNRGGLLSFFYQMTIQATRRMNHVQLTHAYTRAYMAE